MNIKPLLIQTELERRRLVSIFVKNGVISYTDLNVRPYKFM